MYVCKCLSNGNCNILSWIVAIIISFYAIVKTAVLSKIPLLTLLNIDKCYNMCINYYL